MGIQETAIREFEQRLRCVPRILAALNARRGHALDEHELSDLFHEAVEAAPARHVVGGPAWTPARPEGGGPWPAG